jgi:hypothetical protein
MIIKIILLWCLVGLISYTVFRYKIPKNFSLFQDIVGVMLAMILGPIPLLKK